MSAINQPSMSRGPKEERAFAAFLTVWVPQLRRMAHCFDSDQALWDDALAFAMSQAWERWEQVRGLSRPRAWLIMTANRRMHRLRAQRDRATLTAPGDLPSSPASDAFFATELELDLKTAMKGLSPRQRMVFVLVRREGFNQVEVAEVVGVSEATISRDLKQACARLRDELGDSYGRNT